ncbi:threonine/serine exporter family protein [Streptomyces sp. CB01373]|uniref:threonine/serine exporter family protein n=1 Tax=Streptomyces sp. CB01373 TaxID=2020325 RepID=UPI000C280F2D|nr:hypothetical protein CG719_34790 [Streptomyces sp. CB01373]
MRTGRTGIAEADRRLTEIEAAPTPYPWWLKFLGIVLFALGFAPLMQPTWYEIATTVVPAAAPVPSADGVDGGLRRHDRTVRQRPCARRSRPADAPGAVLLHPRRLPERGDRRAGRLCGRPARCPFRRRLPARFLRRRRPLRPRRAQRNRKAAP